MSMNLTKRCTSRILDAKGYVGKNLFDKSKTIYNKKVTSITDGTIITSTVFNVSEYIPVLSNTNYYLSGVVNYTSCAIAYYDANKNYISGDSGNTGVKTSPASAAYMVITLNNDSINTLQLELGSVATNYSPYSPSALNANALIDRSARRNNGTFSNVSWVKLPSGLWTMNFNGTDSYVEIADSPSMRMTNGGTICAWIYARTIGETAGRIIDKSSDTSGQNGFYVALASTNKISLRINSGNSTISSENSIPYSTWKFVVITFNSSGRKIYVNATDVTASGGSETALPPNVSGVVRIGNLTGGTNRTFDGYIALPKIYNKILTQTEIARLFNSQRGFFGV